MGPVSFESLDVGLDRSEAVLAAEHLRAAGIRVVSIFSAEREGEIRFGVVVGTTDLSLAKTILASAGEPS